MTVSGAVSRTVIVRLAWDLLQWCGLLLRPRESLEAEILFLRRQLALYRERGVKPKRLDAATCAWRIQNSAHRVCKSATTCIVNFVATMLRMRERVILLTHLIATVARLLLPGGARSIIAECCGSNISS